MNIKFLQILQSLAEVEKDPDFRSKKYVVVDKEDRRVESDQVPVVLKHPENVFVVASPTGDAPPPGERRIEQLSVALRLALASSERGFKGCSIVVHEGMYINPTLGMKSLARSFPKDFYLEIIGLEGVRILNTLNPRCLFRDFDFHLSLKNLLIYDRGNIFPAIFVAESHGELSLTHVRLHGSSHYSMFLLGGSVGDIQESSFYKCHSLFRVDESEAYFRGCKCVELFNIGYADRDSLLSLNECAIRSADGFVVYGAFATIRQCDFCCS